MANTNKHSPILIAGPPRSGTTLIAGLFIKHGVWAGECKITKYPKTNSLIGTENIEIKKYLKSLYPSGYKNWRVPVPDINGVDINEFKNNILSIVNTDKQWLVKTSNLLLTWRLWNKAWPNAFWILPHRDKIQTIASARRHPAMKRRGKLIEPFITSLRERQAGIQCIVNNSIRPDIDLIVKTRGKAGVADLLFDCGCVYDVRTAYKFIKPEMYHYA